MSKSDQSKPSRILTSATTTAEMVSTETELALVAEPVDGATINKEDVEILTSQASDPETKISCIIPVYGDVQEDVGPLLTNGMIRTYVPIETVTDTDTDTDTNTNTDTDTDTENESGLGLATRVQAPRERLTIPREKSHEPLFRRESLPTRERSPGVEESPRSTGTRDLLPSDTKASADRSLGPKIDLSLGTLSGIKIKAQAVHLKTARALRQSDITITEADLALAKTPEGRQHLADTNPDLIVAMKKKGHLTTLDLDRLKPTSLDLQNLSLAEQAEKIRPIVNEAKALFERTGKKTAILGHVTETHSKGFGELDPEYNKYLTILEIPDWTMEKNLAWIKGLHESHALDNMEIRTISKPREMKPTDQYPPVFHTELNVLYNELGYFQVGSYIKKIEGTNHPPTTSLNGVCIHPSCYPKTPTH